MGCTSSTQVAPEQNSTKPASHGGPVTPRPTVAAGGTTNEQDGTTRILVTPQGSGLGSMRNAPAGGAGQSSDTPSRRASIEMTKGLFSISKGGSVTPLTTADEEEKKKFGNMSPMTDAYLKGMTVNVILGPSKAIDFDAIADPFERRKAIATSARVPLTREQIAQLNTFPENWTSPSVYLPHTINLWQRYSAGKDTLNARSLRELASDCLNLYVSCIYRYVVSQHKKPLSEEALIKKALAIRLRKLPGQNHNDGVFTAVKYLHEALSRGQGPSRIINEEAFVSNFPKAHKDLFIFAEKDDVDRDTLVRSLMKRLEVWKEDARSHVSSSGAGHAVSASGTGGGMGGVDESGHRRRHSRDISGSGLASISSNRRRRSQPDVDRASSGETPRDLSAVFSAAEPPNSGRRSSRGSNRDRDRERDRDRDRDRDYVEGGRGRGPHRGNRNSNGNGNGHGHGNDHDSDGGYADDRDGYGNGDGGSYGGERGDRYDQQQQQQQQGSTERRRHSRGELPPLPVSGGGSARRRDPSKGSGNYGYLANSTSYSNNGNGNGNGSGLGGDGDEEHGSVRSTIDFNRIEEEDGFQTPPSKRGSQLRAYEESPGLLQQQQQVSSVVVVATTTPTSRNSTSITSAEFPPHLPISSSSQQQQQQSPSSFQSELTRGGGSGTGSFRIKRSGATPVTMP